MIKMKGRLLLFDKVGKTKLLFPKDCELTYPEKVPVVWEFITGDPTAVMGSGLITKDEKGLTCEVDLVQLGRDCLHEKFHDELYIGGYYENVKRRLDDDIQVIEKCTLVGIGITFKPADEELKMVVVEGKEEMKDDL